MTDEDCILFQLYHIKAYDFEQTSETPLKSTQSYLVEEESGSSGKVS
jgi:hypothetical protein